MVIPEQPWLDGYCIEKGTIRQFVAMPLGDGYSAEEQITGKAEHGSIQIMAYPMKAEAYEALARMREEARAHVLVFAPDEVSRRSASSFLPQRLEGQTPYFPAGVPQ